MAADGGVFSFCQPFLGSMGGQHLNAPIVGLAETPGGGGYWEVGSDGGIFSYGNASFHGSTGSLHLNAPIVGMAATPDGGGYWLVASDGGIFNYGDAASTARPDPSTSTSPSSAWPPRPTAGAIGSWPPTAASSATATPISTARRGGHPLNKPIVGMAASATGRLLARASDGGIFNYGDAAFYGSTGAIALNKPVVGMAATPDGGGYWLVASDGGIFSYGDAVFNGSTGDLALNAPIVAMG